MKSSLWPSFIERVRGMARDELRNNSDGRALVCIDLYVDGKGDPVGWLKPIVRRVEPSSAAQDILARIVGLHSRGEISAEVMEKIKHLIGLDKTSKP